jgi:hypothetical protein
MRSGEYSGGGPTKKRERLHGGGSTGRKYAENTGLSTGFILEPTCSVIASKDAPGPVGMALAEK